MAALVLHAASVNAAAAQTGAEARLLFLLRDASALAVVDPASGTVLGQVPTVSGPHEVTATPDGKLAFVASPSDGISVIDLETLTELRRLDIGAGSEPHDVRFADGKLYFTSEEGSVYVIRAGPEFELLAENQMNEVSMATPAFSEGVLFIRTRSALVAVSE